eukprot:TRINITY_DN8246_c0_g3_i3.p1 TRINITY_DN8246_c0_g3~~TRINITY_DN8246_c0_g3_i3.p1  ORF type:complete len:276 (+),score=50.76 TRINITY_DN8246_c0_g3_i3:171-998(+)
MFSTSLLGYKLESTGIIFSVSFLGGVLPLKRQSSVSFLQLGNCFGGGVFLSAALLHMFPESVEGFSSLGNYYERHAYIFFIVGLLIPFFVERVLISSHSHSHLGTTEDKFSSTISAYFFMFALSVHSLIEGMALGVQSDFQGTSTILWAIVAHKFFAAVALGISLLKGNLNVGRYLQMIATFCLTTPIGAGLGVAMSSFLEMGLHTFFSQMAKALASGTFVYVALVEVLTQEFESHKSDHDAHMSKKEKFKKFSAILFGAFLMGFTSLYSDHHEH